VFHQRPSITEHSATGLFRSQVGRCNPLQVVQSDGQYPLPVGAALLWGAAKEGAKEGADGFARGGAGLVDACNDAENGFFQGLSSMLICLQPIQRLIKVSQRAG